LLTSLLTISLIRNHSGHSHQSPTIWDRYYNMNRVLSGRAIKAKGPAETTQESLLDDAAQGPKNGDRVLQKGQEPQSSEIASIEAAKTIMQDLLESFIR
jgi:hypothetical protein